MPSSAFAFNNELPIGNNPPLDLLAYKVQPGDTVSEIITKHYNIAFGSSDYQRALLSLEYINPEIANVNAIYPGEIIRLMPLTAQGAAAYCPIPPQQVATSVDRETVLQFMRDNPLNLADLSHYRQFWPQTAQEQDVFWALAFLEENYGILSVSAAAGFNTFDRLVSAPNNALLEEVKFLYQQMLDGKITRNQYNYRRQNALKLYSQKLGPFEKLLLKGKTSREAIRISRSKTLPATAKIDKQLGRLSNMAKLSKHGGILLTGAGLGVGCYQIANAQDRVKKNEILVETTASSVVGVAASVVLGAVLVSNPIGWGVALMVGASTAIGSYAVGKSFSYAYTKTLNHVDIVDYVGLDKICK